MNVKNRLEDRWKWKFTYNYIDFVTEYGSMSTDISSWGKEGGMGWAVGNEQIIFDTIAHWLMADNNFGKACKGRFHPVRFPQSQLLNCTIIDMSYWGNISWLNSCKLRTIFKSIAMQNSTKIDHDDESYIFIFENIFTFSRIRILKSYILLFIARISCIVPKWG